MIIRISTILLLLSAIAQDLHAARKREVSFNNGTLTLRGTLYLPKGEGPFPAVVFVHGSGPETRANSSFSANWLASIGYVALTYDKRGTGKSDGAENDWKRFSFDNLASDAMAALDYLSDQPEVDPSRIGIHATSQGGWVAALAGTQSAKVSFMIIRSASVTTVEADRIFERSERLKREGFSKTDIAEATKMQMVEAKTTLNDNDPDEFAKLFEAYQDRGWFARVYGGTDPFTTSLIAYRRWYASIYRFDPVPLLEQMDTPIFWIFGDPDLDTNGPVTQSLQNLQKLQTSGKPYQIHVYEGQGHNVKERKYESALYDWLCEIDSCRSYKFKRH